MPLKLVVNKTDEPAAQPDSFVFQQERITIGRDAATNDLPLADTKRVVSKQHAELVVSGSSIHLTDLGSKNFTYLNGERLQSGHPYPVRPGDTIRIGDFEIGVSEIEAVLAPPRAPSHGEDQTVFDIAYVNPFEDSAKLLAVALRSLSKQYDDEAANRRDDALADALNGALEGDTEHTAYRLIAHLLAPEVATAPTTATPPPAPPIAPVPPVASMPPVAASPPTAPPSRLPMEPPAAPPRAAPPRPTPPMGAPARPVAGNQDRVHNILDAVLRAMSQLAGVPWQFRHEFIGQTIMQTEETAFLYEGDGETLKRHLLDPELTDEEARYRLRLLEDAANDVQMHQVAMLDGYKAAVRDGALNLIDQLNPDALEEAVAGEKWFYRFVPSLAKAEVLERLHAQLKELRSEDWAAAERRTYRPAFAKAYLNRMTSLRRRDSRTHGF